MTAPTPPPVPPVPPWIQLKTTGEYMLPGLPGVWVISAMSTSEADPGRASLHFVWIGPQR